MLASAIKERIRTAITEHPKTLHTLYPVNITYENLGYHDSYIQR